MNEASRQPSHRGSPSPTVPTPRPSGLSSVLERNISALAERRTREQADAPWPDRLAARITRFIGSMTFAAIHAVVFGGWALVNSGVLSLLPKWDETFVILGTTASVEAIFLSTFVLINQNRMSALDAQRADLDLQVSLLSEHEITKLVAMVEAIKDHLGVQTAVDDDLTELKENVAPERVLDEIEERESASPAA